MITLNENTVSRNISGQCYTIFVTPKLFFILIEQKELFITCSHLAEKYGSCYNMIGSTFPNSFLFIVREMAKLVMWVLKFAISKPIKRICQLNGTKIWYK